MLLKIALFRLAFAAAPTLYVLTSQHIVTRRPVLQKVRDNTFTPCGVRSAFSACKHTISGSISLPFRGAFHLSLTVLNSIGHLVVFSLGRWSSQLPTQFHVLGGTPDTCKLWYRFRVQGFYLVSRCFPNSFGYLYQVLIHKSTTPHILLYTVWALARSLATTKAIVNLLSFPPGTKMFQFPGFPLANYEFIYE